MLRGCWLLFHLSPGLKSDGVVKVACIFRSNMASTYQPATMILPQLEGGYHGAEAGGMFFFDDNVFVLRAGELYDPSKHRCRDARFAN